MRAWNNSWSFVSSSFVNLASFDPKVGAMRKSFSVFVLLSLCFLSASSQSPPQQTPPQNEQFQALQAHFDRVINERFNRLFAGLENVPQWEPRKERTRQALEKMLWHNRSIPSGPPQARLVRREERSEYTIEILILETAPGLYLTANLYLPRRRRETLSGNSVSMRPLEQKRLRSSWRMVCRARHRRPCYG